MRNIQLGWCKNNRKQDGVACWCIMMQYNGLRFQGRSLHKMTLIMHSVRTRVLLEGEFRVGKCLFPLGTAFIVYMISK